MLTAAKSCLVDYGFDKATLRKIADRAGVSDSLLIHQFGSREQLLVEAIDAPEGLDRAMNLIRKFPKGMWGRVLAEAMQRGEVRNPTARQNLELIVRASAQSEACAEMITDWVTTQLTDEIRKLGVSQPEVRARAFATMMFGVTYTHDVLKLPDFERAEQRAQTKIRSRVLQAILAEEL